MQLDARNLSLGRRHLVNAYELNAGIGVIAGNTVWSMPERHESEVLHKVRYINTLTFTFTFIKHSVSEWTVDCANWNLTLTVVITVYVSGVPERHSVRLLHGALQHAVGTHQVSRLAHNLPAVHPAVDSLRTTGQGRSAALSRDLHVVVPRRFKSHSSGFPSQLTSKGVAES